MSEKKLVVYVVYIVYICGNFIEKFMYTAIQTKRKLIDVQEDTLRVLSVKAAMEGTNVKNLIEQMIMNEAEKIEEAIEFKLYTSLLQSDPEGKVYLDKAETLTFEKRIGV